MACLLHEQAPQLSDTMNIKMETILMTTLNSRDFFTFVEIPILPLITSGFRVNQYSRETLLTHENAITLICKVGVLKHFHNCKCVVTV